MVYYQLNSIKSTLATATKAVCLQWWHNCTRSSVPQCGTATLTFQEMFIWVWEFCLLVCLFFCCYIREAVTLTNVVWQVFVITFHCPAKIAQIKPRFCMLSPSRLNISICDILPPQSPWCIRRVCVYRKSWTLQGSLIFSAKGICPSPND